MAGARHRQAEGGRAPRVGNALCRSKEGLRRAWLTAVSLSPFSLRNPQGCRAQDATPAPGHRSPCPFLWSQLPLTNSEGAPATGSQTQQLLGKLRATPSQERGLTGEHPSLRGLTSPPSEEQQAPGSEDQGGGKSHQPRHRPGRAVPGPPLEGARERCRQSILPRQDLLLPVSSLPTLLGSGDGPGRPPCSPSAKQGPRPLTFPQNEDTATISGLSAGMAPGSLRGQGCHRQCGTALQAEDLGLESAAPLNTQSCVLCARPPGLSVPHFLEE